MAKSEASKQKKLAKKRSKDNAKRREAAREKNRSQSFAGRWETALGSPFVHCYVSDSTIPGNGGLGSVIVSRRVGQGKVVMIRLLIDAMMLGVKSVEVEFVAPHQVSNMVDLVNERGAEHLRVVEVPYAAKFVHSAIEFAANLGLQPNPQWSRVSDLFAGVDYSNVEAEFKFGKDGKPLYMPGPFDTWEDRRRVQEAVAEAGIELPNFNHIELFQDDDLSALDDPELDVDIDEDVADEPNSETIDTVSIPNKD